MNDDLIHFLFSLAFFTALAMLFTPLTGCEPIEEAKRLITSNDSPKEHTSEANVTPHDANSSTNEPALSTDASTLPSLPNTPARNLPTADNNTLWKPVSENNGNLVIVTAHKIDLNTVDEITVNGEVGNAYYPEPKDGVPRNGGRGTVRFDHPGAWYGVNVPVRIVYKDGRAVEYVQGDGSKRGNLKGGE